VKPSKSAPPPESTALSPARAASNNRDYGFAFIVSPASSDSRKS
jgi:hypothetical protein